MTSKNKHLLIALAVTAVLTAAVVAYYLYRKKLASTSAVPGVPAAVPASTEPETASSLTASSGGWSPSLGLPTIAPAPLVIMSIRPSEEATSKLPRDETLMSVQPMKATVPAESLTPTGKGAVMESAPAAKFPLKEGSSGSEVAQLQSFLVSEHGAQFPQGISSNFDGATRAAVVKHLRRDTVSQAYFDKVGMGSRRRF